MRLECTLGVSLLETGSTETSGATAGIASGTELSRGWLGVLGDSGSFGANRGAGSSSVVGLRLSLLFFGASPDMMEDLKWKLVKSTKGKFKTANRYENNPFQVFY